MFVSVNIDSVAVAQWIAYQTSDLGVAGSSPAGNMYFCILIRNGMKKERKLWNLNC